MADYYAYSSSVALEVATTDTGGLAAVSSVTAEVISTVSSDVLASSVFVEVLARGFVAVPYVPGIAIPWTLRPNWSEGVVERLMWMTDVLTSQSGVEQRRMLRLSPRRQVDAPFRVWDNKRRWLDSALRGPGAALFHMPVWWEPMRLTATVEVGGNVLECNCRDMEVTSGSTIMILGSTPFIYEMGIVNSLSTARDQLILGTTITQTWPKGTTVYLCKLARIVNDPEFTKSGNNSFEGTVTFQVTEPNDHALDPAEDDVTFPMLYIEPAWMEDVSVSYNRMYAEFDNQVGIPARRDVALQTFNIQRVDFLLRNRREHAQFRSMLYYFGGKLRPFYTTTNLVDLKYISYATSHGTDNFIFVERCGMSALIGSEVMKDTLLAFFLYDGRSFTIEIKECGIVSTDAEIVTFKTTLNQDFTAKDVKRISYVQIMRQDQDDVEILHHTDVDGGTTCTTTFKALARQPRIAGDYTLNYYTGVYVKNELPPAIPVDAPRPPVVEVDPENPWPGYVGSGSGGNEQDRG